MPSTVVLASRYGLPLDTPPEFVWGYADTMRMDSVRPSCMECVEKHLGAALVLMGEAEAGYPEHKLLAIGHLHEAAEESADMRPELSALLRDIRKRYQQGEAIEFETILEALNQHGVWRFDQRGQGVACGNGWIPRSKKCSRDKAAQTSKEAKAKTVEKAKARGELKRAVKAGKGQKAYVKPRLVESATAGETKTVKDKRLGRQVTKVLMSDGSEIQFDQKFPDKIAKPLAEIHARKLSGEAIAPQDLASTLLGGRFNASTKEANLFLEQSRELGIPSESLWVGEGPRKKSAIDFQADQNLRSAKQGDIEKRINQLKSESEYYSAKGAERAKRGRTRGAGAGGFNRDLDRIKIGRDIAEGEIERLQAELNRRANRTDSYIQGYLEVMSWRFDRKGEGVACG